jgi:hypothetical protein
MHLTNFILAFFGCGSTLWLVRMIIAYRRSRMAPKCWCCGMSKVVPWKIHRTDYLALLSMMVPMRCLGCLTRFYGLRWVRPASRKSASTKRRPVPQPQLIPVRLRVRTNLDEAKATAVAVSN